MSLLRRLWAHTRRQVQKHFLAGLLVIVPLGLTYYVVSAIVKAMDRVLAILPHRFHPDTYLPFEVPGLGVIVTLLIIQTVGFLGANLLGRGVVKSYERILESIPVVRTLYIAIKQLLEQMISGDAGRFRRVVLVEYPRKGLYSLGFVTGVTRGEIQQKTAERVVNVFLPTTPNPTSGFYLLVPEKDAVPLEISVEDAFKLIISAGLVGSEPKKVASGAAAGQPPAPGSG
ncbi:MAG: DUF502 domain-containing protein [Deferrisomatales bacterium]|nr:DUF502 domain-containing protein [Deferrisomatales bacterium]